MNWTNKAVPLPSRDARNIHCGYEKGKKKKEWKGRKKDGGSGVSRSTFPLRLIGAPQLVKSVTCRSFTDKQGRHGSITHSYHLSLFFSHPAPWRWRDNTSIFDTNNFICLMVFLDRPIHRSERSKKKAWSKTRLRGTFNDTPTNFARPLGAHVGRWDGTRMYRVYLKNFCYKLQAKSCKHRKRTAWSLPSICEDSNRTSIS